jgi:hypothetical protein
MNNLLIFYSQETFSLVQLRNDPPWTLVEDSHVTLSGAHGSEIVRSFCFLDKVRQWNAKPETLLKYLQNKMVLTAGEDGEIRAFQS